jgi:eukaryotic-like serine/threonine-protein kinase
MPFIDGETLRAKLDRETQLGIDEALRITTSIADALDYAHRQGVDTATSSPRTSCCTRAAHGGGLWHCHSGFGGGRRPHDGEGLSLGTPHYMSPEQATAEREISARSDTYSLASVLYEMLAGDPPHTGSSAQQIIMKIITETARPVTELRKAVPPNIAAALAIALEKLPADRFESAKAFADALSNRAFAVPAGAATSMAAGGTRTWRGWIHDPRSWAALLAVAVMGFIASPVWNGPSTAADRATTLRFTIEGPSDPSILAVGAMGSPPRVSDDGRALESAPAISN